MDHLAWSMMPPMNLSASIAALVLLLATMVNALESLTVWSRPMVSVDLVRLDLILQEKDVWITLETAKLWEAMEYVWLVTPTSLSLATLADPAT